MNRPDDVFCASCGRAFAIGLLELVRHKGRLECAYCAALEDYAALERLREEGSSSQTSE